jgi:hypothetical protein
MVLLHRFGIHDARCLSIYRRAVGDVLACVVGADETIDWAALEPVVDEQLAMLEQALVTRVPGRPVVDFTVPVSTSAEVAPPRAVASPQASPVDPPRGRARRPTHAAQDAMSMEDKLRESRKPIQKLLREDCVQACLIDLGTAECLIQGMTGKSSEDAEQEIVDRLRESLQQQIRGFIRQTGGEGPWSNPHAQEELRQDVHRMRSVQGVLSMARHVRREYRSWEREHGWYGILGLFSPRRKLRD